MSSEVTDAMADPITKLRAIADAADPRGLVTVEAGNLRALVAEHRAMEARSDDGLVDVECEAARIVAENIEKWGWGPLEDIEGLTEHMLALSACEAGYRAALSAKDRP